MADDKQTKLQAAYAHFANCLNREDMIHNSWPMALVGAGIGAKLGNLPGAAAGALIGYTGRASYIAYGCFKEAKDVEPPPPTPTHREIAPGVQASR